MRKTFLAALLASGISSEALSQTETRCGWIDNPSPANWWLTDADGEWTISLQGLGWPSEIFDIEWGGTSEWVETNVHYGFGCGCIVGGYDHETGWLTTAQSAQWLPLAQCSGDPALPPRL